MSVHVMSTIVVNNTAQNSSDNLPSCPPHNHYDSDVVYWKGRDLNIWLKFKHATAHECSAAQCMPGWLGWVAQW